MDAPTHSNPGRLFFASCVALTVTAMSFAIRGDIMGDLEKQFSLSHTESGVIAGTAFWGFTLAMIFGGPLCDVMGMGRLLIIAFVGHLLGIAMTIFAGGYWGLFAGTVAIGLANGLVEAACNPLVATLYPNDKTHRLNQFHVWFPGGIVIGGLLCYLITRTGSHAPGEWKLKMCAMFVPTLLYGALFLGKNFPRTERVQSGVSTGSMFTACASPLFIMLVLCMLLTAATELGTNQWIPEMLKNAISQNAQNKPVAVAGASSPAKPASPAVSEKVEKSASAAAAAAAAATAEATSLSAPTADNTLEGPAASAQSAGKSSGKSAQDMLEGGSEAAGASAQAAPPQANPATGILILVWISGLMAVGRQFAGPIVHRLSPTGMLLFSAIFSTIGLIGISLAHSVGTAFVAATIFSIGICYFWPTMIGITSELIPKSGALGMAIMGGAGMLSVSIILPVMGNIYDEHGAAIALRYTAVLPAVLVLVFGGMFVYYRKAGGYKAEKLG